MLYCTVKTTLWSCVAKFSSIYVVLKRLQGFRRLDFGLEVKVLGFLFGAPFRHR